MNYLDETEPPATPSTPFHSNSSPRSTRPTPIRQPSFAPLDETSETVQLLNEDEDGEEASQSAHVPLPVSPEKKEEIMGDSHLLSSLRMVYKVLNERDLYDALSDFNTSNNTAPERKQINYWMSLSAPECANRPVTDIKWSNSPERFLTSYTAPPNQPKRDPSTV